MQKSNELEVRSVHNFGTCKKNAAARCWLQIKKTYCAAKFVGSRHCAARFFFQVPNLCTDIDWTLFFILILTTYTEIAWKNKMPALGVRFAALLERWPQICCVKITFWILLINFSVSTRINSRKCFVNWIALRIRVRLINTQPHLKKWFENLPLSRMCFQAEMKRPGRGGVMFRKGFEGHHGNNRLDQSCLIQQIALRFIWAHEGSKKVTVIHLPLKWMPRASPHRHMFRQPFYIRAFSYYKFVYQKSFWQEVGAKAVTLMSLLAKRMPLRSGEFWRILRPNMFENRKSALRNGIFFASPEVVHRPRSNYLIHFDIMNI